MLSRYTQQVSQKSTKKVGLHVCTSTYSSSCQPTRSPLHKERTYMFISIRNSMLSTHHADVHAGSLASLQLLKQQLLCNRQASDGCMSYIKVLTMATAASGGSIGRVSSMGTPGELAAMWSCDSSMQLMCVRRHITEQCTQLVREELVLPPTFWDTLAAELCSRMCCQLRAVSRGAEAHWHSTANREQWYCV